MTSTRIILLLSIAMTGCQWGNHRRETKFVEPALSTSIGRNELVEYLNSQNKGLESWRCMNTQVHVSMPGLPLPQKLSGTLACAAPSQFRLVSDNLVAHADFGSNSDICWAYIKPGDSVVMTWKHEDSHLLQHLPGGLPRLEPEWLMTVLGVQPLDAERYELQNAPSGSRELWLVSVEDAPDGTSLRRVIKVDTVLGVAREHALYDSDGQALLRAQLSNHKSCGGHRLPHTVRVSFPQCETELTLHFNGIETDCRIADSLWHPPHGRNIEVVDLGDVVRTRMQMDPQFQRLQKTHPLALAPQKSVLVPGETATDGMAGSQETRDRRIFVDQVASSKREKGDRFFGDEPAYDIPDWDESRGARSDETPFNADDSLERPLNVPLQPPDFDVVAPQQPKGKRRGWLPFWK